MSVDADLRGLIRAELDELVAIRHDLHAHPELMYRERRTSGVVQRELEALGVSFRAGVGSREPGGEGTGVIAHLPALGADGGDHVALRADMDALPIEEATGVAHASTTPGVMHACGHDAHTTILIGAARVLSKLGERRNAVTLVFQPAEEGGHGGDRMIRDGALDGHDGGPPVQRIYGLHGWPDMPLGVIGTRPGPLLAATDQFDVTIRGKGGHAAFPHTCVDPVPVAAQIVTALQTVVSRETRPTDSAVLTVSAIHGGSAYNVIADEVTFRGTYRSLDMDTRAAAKARFREMVESMARAMGCEVDVTWHDGYPPTLNDAAEAERVLAIAGAAFGEDRTTVIPEPFMGGEDFAYYGLRVPACFFTLGLCPEGVDPETRPRLHQPTFDFNDDAIATGVEMMVRMGVSG